MLQPVLPGLLGQLVQEHHPETTLALAWRLEMLLAYLLVVLGPMLVLRCQWE